jgi:hypothetical protein
MHVTGTPVAIRNDSQIDFNWGDSSPFPGSVNADEFSARWTRTLDLDPGRYRFTMKVDDGGRLWVNGHLLIDAWRDQAASTFHGELDLTGDPVDVRMEYYENAGLALSQLSWDRIGTLAPAAVTDLQVTHAVVDAGQLTAYLRWTAPARAKSFALRYSHSLITEANWEQAMEVVPPFAGTPSSTNWSAVSVPYSGSTVYLALRSQDSEGDWSELSNNAFWPAVRVWIPFLSN